MQPGSSGRDIDFRRQQSVGVTDDAKLKSSCTTRVSPAVAHGADDGYSIMEEQSDTAVTAGNEDDSLSASALQNNTAAALADDQSSAKNSYHSVRSLKHKNDQSNKYGTGSADSQRASSLQDLNDSGGSSVERSPQTESKVSCGLVKSDVESGMHHLHDKLPLSAHACSSNCACTRHDKSLMTYADEESLPQSRSRCHTRRPATNPQPELVDHTGIVSNTAQFWEDLVLDSGSSGAQCGVRSRYMSEDRRRFMRRDGASLRYLTIGTPCDVVHGMGCVTRTTSDVLLRSKSLHVNNDLEVCVFVFYVTTFVFFFCCMYMCMSKLLCSNQCAYSVHVFCLCYHIFTFLHILSYPVMLLLHVS